jgi:hypothetical protein
MATLKFVLARKKSDSAVEQADKVQQVLDAELEMLAAERSISKAELQTQVCIHH